MIRPSPDKTIVAHLTAIRSILAIMQDKSDYDVEAVAAAVDAMSRIDVDAVGSLRLTSEGALEVIASSSKAGYGLTLLMKDSWEKAQDYLTEIAPFLPKTSAER